jgi:hypothetical protein
VEIILAVGALKAGVGVVRGAATGLAEGTVVRDALDLAESARKLGCRAGMLFDRAKA